MSQNPYSFVLWAIPRFHRNGPAAVVATTANGTGEISAPERSPRDEEKPQPASSPAGQSAGRWRYALS